LVSSLVERTIMAIKSRILSSIYRIAACCMLGLAVLSAVPASALTPLRSPEQLARDKVLVERATQIIASQVSRCLLEVPDGQRRSFDVRFFLSDGGQRVTQLSIVDADAGSRPAISARERSAIKAIKACAPYTLPEELRTWGGFWVTAAF
jgi:hypothetical protein